MVKSIREKIITARNNGRSITWMIKHIGCSGYTINYHLMRANLLNKRATSTHDLVISLRNQGFTRENIALMIGVHIRTVSKHLKTYREREREIKV